VEVTFKGLRDWVPFKKSKQFLNEVWSSKGIFFPLCLLRRTKRKEPKIQMEVQIAA
jgi:hypothetical protein